MRRTKPYGQTDEQLMETRYSKVVARELKEAMVEIYGLIGDKVNGDYLASEINYLGTTADVIIFRINSMGGNVVQGLSVIGSIIASPAKTIAVIEGIAGSMSSVIAMSCKRVKMNDFARLMFHSPYFADDNGDKVNDLSENEKAAVKSFRTQMAELLTRRGKSPEEIDTILKKDTWYTAEEALAAGFIDEIIDTGVSKAAAKLSIEKLVAFVNDKYLTKKVEMKEIAAKLHLPENSDTQAIIAAIDQKEVSLANAGRKLIEAVIAAGKKSGTVNEKNLAAMTKLGEADVNLLIDLVVKPAEASDNVRMSDVVAKVNELLGDNKTEARDQKGWDWYQKNDPEALAAMKVNDLPKFKKMYKEYWGQEFEG